MTAQLRARVVRQPHPFRRAQSFEIVLGLAQARLKAADAETREDCLDLVHDPRLLGDQVPALAVWPSCVLLLDRRDRHHAAMAPLAAQPMGHPPGLSPGRGYEPVPGTGSKRACAAAHALFAFIGSTELR